MNRLFIWTFRRFHEEGDRVRVTGGIFEGVEGEFVRIKGDRRVVVSIRGYGSCHCFHSSLFNRANKELKTQ